MPSKITYPALQLVKNNQLINLRFEIGSVEQKLISILISKIQSIETNFNKCSFEIKELAELLQMTPESLSDKLPRVMKNLLIETLVVESDDDFLIQTTFLTSAIYNKNKEIVELELNPQLNPYLF